MEPELLSYGLTSAAAAGPVGVLLLCAVIYFARRDAKRDDREREDRVQLATALAQNTAALNEVRRVMEKVDTHFNRGDR
jgi:hypothetical protein